MSHEASLPFVRRVAVVGGGITGLAAAHRLRELDPLLDVRLYEASDRVGGVLRTTQRDGWLIEHSADNFITNVPYAFDLCERLGFAEQLLPTDERFRRAYVIHRGRLMPVPEGFALMAPARIWPVLTTPLLSLAGKLRLASEVLQPIRRTTDDESLESFVVRRLGRETFDRIVQPLIGGIYTADPQKLSLAATMPRFLEMERKHGGLIRGALKQSRQEQSVNRNSSGARYSLFVAPQQGMESFVNALAAKLPPETIELASPVASVARGIEGKWLVNSQPYDAVIVTTPAPLAAKLVAEVDQMLGDLLQQIPYAGASVVCLGYRQEQIARPLEGFGYVVPVIEKREVLAVSFASMKFAGRAPAGCVLLRAFIGGALQPELADRPDEELLATAERELCETLGVQGKPLITQICRWHKAMPQYHVGHLNLVGQIEARLASYPGLELAGNAYRGVGVPQCIHSGEAAAERIVKQLSTASLASSPPS
jgi:oxygen-dependent protoporphyrinogen oxidase